MTIGTPLIMAKDIQKSFPLPEGRGTFTVLQNVNLNINKGEVVALLGRSGSGKSTLLRILAGLIPATDGTVTSGDQVVNGANSDVAMVFQSFALLPWATVQENVELGLKAQGISRDERQSRALKAIDMVGLDGFESAYPKELSGGMQQRVGFARAFVMEPNLLFMDEPFSALDVLTAENLRNEIGMLWEQGNFPAQSILLVTHNIEEAVLLADRVLILGSNPGYVRGEVEIGMERPRDRNIDEFKAMVDYIYTVMTNPSEKVTSPTSHIHKMKSSTFAPLPHARVGGISGLVELVAGRGGREDIPQFAQQLKLGANDLLPIIDAATLLGFVEVETGDLLVTDIGQRFAEADILFSKEIFRQQVLLNAPLVNIIYKTLEGKNNHKMRADFFLDILDNYYPEDEAQRQFNTAVDWGRYAELYEFDASERLIYFGTSGNH